MSLIDEWSELDRHPIGHHAGMHDLALVAQEEQRDVAIHHSAINLPSCPWNGRGGRATHILLDGAPRAPKALDLLGWVSARLNYEPLAISTVTDVKLGCLCTQAGLHHEILNEPSILRLIVP